MKKIGNISYIGAKSNFLPGVLKFLCDSKQLDYSSFKGKSLSISVDMVIILISILVNTKIKKIFFTLNHVSGLKMMFFQIIQVMILDKI
jgi:hypothetical protein